jgi:uncharacterized protein YcbX
LYTVEKFSDVWNRRGNIIMEGEAAFQEETWDRLAISQTVLHILAPCKRYCIPPRVYLYIGKYHRWASVLDLISSIFDIRY